MSRTAPSTFDRRAFLRLLGAGAALTATGCQFVGPEDGSVIPAPLVDQWGASNVDDRILVVIELNGGNDGLTTLIPHGDGTYRDRRTRLAVADNDLIDLDGQLGFHRSLARLHSRGLTALAGVGTPGNTLSHFQMLDRWWTGDPEGSGRYETGFLGRCCDALMGDEPVTGVSLGWSPTPTMVSSRARTATLPDLEAAGSLFVDANAELRELLLLAADAGGEQLSPLFAPARRSMRNAVVLTDFLAALAPPSAGYPDTDLGLRLAAASRLIRTNAGIRILHVPAEHDFDTHDNQIAELIPALDDLDRSIDTFLADMDRVGLRDRVLVATTSEFGRRVDENDTGTDHGNASVALLSGPTLPGVHGQQPSLQLLDDDGNLRTQVSFGDYYATLAETWLGIPRNDVLPSGTSTLPELLTV